MRYQSHIRRIITTLLVFSCLSAAATEPEKGQWEGLKQLMNADQFQAAGLDKLSVEELQNLDQWLLQFLAHDAQQLVHSDETVKELQKRPLRRRIAGHFSGWKGDTVFTLENGEVWRQRLPSRYAVSLQNPEVDISRNLFGFYELKVVETGRIVTVTRVK
jgi:hypothetical protein